MFTATQLQALIAAHRDEFFKDLASIIAIPSVKGPAAPHAPFGLAPRQVLDAVVALGQAYGFKAQVVSDAMAYVQWGDNDQNYLGVVGHLDVVAAGDGWTSDPITLTKRGDRWYARGVLDNKGPAISCLFGLKLLKDAGLQPQRTIRLIFGSDEESGSADVPMYLAQEAPPTFGWTPDCKYPVVYGERGIVNYRVETPLPTDTLAQLGDFQGAQGKAFVPDELSVEINGHELSVKGRRSPSNAPEMGINALTLISKQVVEGHLADGALQEYFTWFDQALRDQHFGQGLGIDFSDEDSGRLIVTPYLMERTDTGIALELAMRYPVTVSEAQVTEGLQQHVPAGSKITVVRSMPGTMHDPHDPHLAILSQAYGELTGLDPTPVTTTGATYARVMPNIIAFGPSFPGQKGIAHKEDEWMDEGDLLMNMTIYTLAMSRLLEKGV
ncbi:Sapep family Mn(2+)-dependent dipeptidase [Lacticaseibacillus manihotivorans]|uniref:Dipeptidase n=2 Tax=Lacticaseibacillus manihotivorans TaxID=88233 RepID=A0A0R1QVL9_9LACO|nr:Sapep family Mn(2+)-dependent dipeptidase [Lacticaseibacillus manihotivorans]KRL45387.1 dipeptidase [Lacticaseibacillus manihotivorans DSM 13343 = JCM 12514]QFQ92111.1 Sapep family Mn(2+)-dependent dipeptidase [Lacticaseibacillus manihotivorans]